MLYQDQPYGWLYTEESVKSVSRNDIVNFYETYYRPNNGTLIVVGDVDSVGIKAKLEKVFASWKPADMPAAKNEIQVMKAKPGVYLVDRPGSVQSSVFIGQASVPRNTPDFYGLEVMNKILGGGFSGRLFMNLREDKGYTNGVYSGFAFRKGGGAFSASGEMQSGSTKEAVKELLKELNGFEELFPSRPLNLKPINNL